MTTASGLQERLHNRADVELKNAVTAAMLKMTQELNKVCPGAYANWAEIPIKSGEKVVKYSYDSVIRRLGEAVIAKLQEKYREHVVDTFMGKVNTLHDQIDELRDEIEYRG